MEYNTKELWQQTVHFHGHSCPGLAIGFRIATTFIELFPNLNKEDLKDENLICIAETDACGLDAIQFILSCTMGKGNLLLKLRGKNAFSFYNRKTESALRLLWIADFPKTISREEKLHLFLNSNSNDLIQIQNISYLPPKKALISQSLPCYNCKELTAEHYMKLYQNQAYCQDCLENYSRILA